MVVVFVSGGMACSLKQQLISYSVHKAWRCWASSLSRYKNISLMIMSNLFGHTVIWQTREINITCSLAPSNSCDDTERKSTDHMNRLGFPKCWAQVCSFLAKSQTVWHWLHPDSLSSAFMASTFRPTLLSLSVAVLCDLAPPWHAKHVI